MATPGNSPEERVLVLMPTARDAERTRTLLAEAGLDCAACADIDELCRELTSGAGAVLLTDEVVAGNAAAPLWAAVGTQPAWSDVPLVVLTREGAESRHASIRESANVTLVERPVRMRALISVVRAALRARRHQYEVRDLLAERARAEEAIRERDERIQLLLGHATDYAVIISDPEDRVLEWLGGAEAITGWRADEVMGRPVAVIFTPEDRAAGVPEWETRTAAETGRAENVRWHQREDGSLFFAEGVTVSLRDPAGELRGFGKVFRDATARKLSEERLTRDAMLLANVHDAVVMTDTGGVVTYWNEGAARLFGWTAAEMVGRHYADRFEEPVRSWIREEIRKRAEGSEWSGEYEDYRRDGSRVWIDARVTNVRDATGEVVGVLGVSHDISERKRAEAALRASEERYRALVTTSWDAVYRMSADWAEMQPLDGRNLVASNAEPIRGWMQKNVPESEQARVREAIGRAVATRQPFELEHQVVRPDGTLGWTYSRAVPIVGDGGDIVEWFGTARDVTAQKAADKALRASEERYRTLFASIDEGFCVIEVLFDGDTPTDYRFLEVNPAFEKHAGLKDAAGRTMRELAPEHDAHWFEAYGRVARTGKPERFEREAAALGRWFDVYAFPLGDKVAILFTDITARRRDEQERELLVEQLREADRKKDDFIALLAHELRNPLAPIRNGLQVLRLSPDRDARERAQQMMDRQLTHMVRLIDDLLDVSRISRNKMELRLARILLSDAVGSAVETARPLIEAAGHELVVDLPPDPVFLDADLTRLAQVFANLLTNSAKYTERGGRIVLAARRDGDAVVVSVTDTGIGIPAESLPRIFDMFSQVDRSLERTTGGLGIGLALVRGLVEMHGGTVEARSEGPGRGSEFVVRLPAVPVRAVSPAEFSTGQNGAPAGPGRRILVVDDNRDAAESMAEMLRLFGHEVALAHDGEEAVERAGSFRPRVILMDVGMPRLNGYQAARRIREQVWGKDVAIVALTGWGQDSDRVRSKEAGCDGHLVKPVSLPDLQNLLGELVQGSPGDSEVLL